MGIWIYPKFLRYKDNKLEFAVIKDIELHTIPFSRFEPLFNDYKKILQKLYKRKIDLNSFFVHFEDEKIFLDYIKQHITDFKPENVKSKFVLLKRLLKEHSDKFPYMYWIKNTAIPQLMESGGNIFINDKVVLFDSDWNECNMYIDEKIIDLTNGPYEYEGYLALRENKEGKWIYVKGKKVKLTILKCSFYDVNESYLNFIIDICDYAVKHDLLVCIEYG